MRSRWFPYLLSVMLCLLLLPSAALAQNSQANWGKGRWGTNNRSNQTSRQRVWGARNRPQSNRVGWGYRNNGYYGNPNYRQGGYWAYRDWDRDADRDYWRHRHHDWRRGRCVDPDHDGDCDFIVRHRHHRWHDDDDDDGGWRNGRWHGSTPPGWHHGRKVGWGDSDLPPGQAKRAGWY